MTPEVEALVLVYLAEEEQTSAAPEVEPAPDTERPPPTSRSPRSARVVDREVVVEVVHG